MLLLIFLDTLPVALLILYIRHTFSGLYNLSLFKMMAHSPNS